jgi:hypothetical protein
MKKNLKLIVNFLITIKAADFWWDALGQIQPKLA